MNASEFNRRGEALLGGYGWKARLARGTGNNYATVKRWAAGSSPVPKIVIALFECLEALNAADAAFPSRFEPVARRRRLTRSQAAEALQRAPQWPLPRAAQQ